MGKKLAKSYDHPESESLLRPDVGTQAQRKKKKPPKTYRYDSSLSPALEWDGQNPAREAGEALIRRIHEAKSLEEAKAAAAELRALAKPFLNWAGKAVGAGAPLVPDVHAGPAASLLLCRELLAPSGSIFVQISDENLHHVREVMDEVFGQENFYAVIVVQKTGGLGTSTLKVVADYLLWYARDAQRLKYRQVYRRKLIGLGEGSGARYDQLMSSDGKKIRAMTPDEREDPSLFLRIGERFS
jgi:hypothetical protein